METQKRYSELLSSILEKNSINCLCPKMFLGNLKKFKNGTSNRISSISKDSQHSILNIDKETNQQANGEMPFKKKDKSFSKPCPLGTNCQFAPRQFSSALPGSTCNKAKCTCFLQCSCISETQLNKMSAKQNNSTVKNVFVEPNCICKPCICGSKESVLNQENRPPPHVDNVKCVCSVCLCQNTDSSRDLFPNSFRNLIKLKTNQLMSSEMIKQECDEIKLLLNDHKKSEKIEPEKNTTKSKQSTTDVSKPINTDLESVSTFTIISNEVKNKPVLDNVELTQKISSNYKNSLQDKKIKQHTNSRHPVKKKDKAINKKFYSKDKMNSYRTQCSVKKNPLHIRYYYSGGTENYGVKLGHKMCLNKPALVPKHMGWLWNYEDETKGLRERKGWPPGTLGSKVMHLLRHCKSDTVSGNKVFEHKQWKSPPTAVPEYKEPKEEPPLLHIIKKGRTYNITFCPKSSDQDIEPIPIPFTITGNKHDDDTETSNSTLEFEFHSPEPRLKLPLPEVVPTVTGQITTEQTSTVVPTPLTNQPLKPTKGKLKSKNSRWLDENNVSWEEQHTQIQNIS